MTCPTGKQPFTKVQAQDKARRASRRYSTGIAAYHCAECGAWHFGHHYSHTSNSCRSYGAITTSTAARCGPVLFEEHEMRRLIEFIQIFRLYARHNTIRYSARIAYGVAFKGLPF